VVKQWNPATEIKGVGARQLNQWVKTVDGGQLASQLEQGKATREPQRRPSTVNYIKR
jgi:hypothetical protein